MREVDKAVQKLLEKGAMELVENPSSTSFNSCLFLIPKRDGVMRPVINLSVLNRYLMKEKLQDGFHSLLSLRGEDPYS